MVLRLTQGWLGVLVLGCSTVAGWFIVTEDVPAIAVILGAWVALGFAALGIASIVSACTKS
jgi:hypothetical protein